MLTQHACELVDVGIIFGEHNRNYLGRQIIVALRRAEGSTNNRGGRRCSSAALHMHPRLVWMVCGLHGGLSRARWGSQQ